MSVRSADLIALGLDVAGRRRQARVVVMARTRSTGHCRFGVTDLQGSRWRRLAGVRPSPVSGFQVSTLRNIPKYARMALRLCAVPEGQDIVVFSYDLDSAPTARATRPDRQRGDVAGWSRAG